MELSQCTVYLYRIESELYEEIRTNIHTYYKHDDGWPKMLTQGYIRFTQNNTHTHSHVFVYVEVKKSEFHDKINTNVLLGKFVTGWVLITCN